jgi:adenylyltransferase/sulfurtransferase
MRAGKAWVDGGIDGLEGTARVFRPGENCYACNLGPEAMKGLAWRMPCSGIIRRNEEAGRAATTPITASIIAAVQVQEALKLIHHEQLEAGELTSLCGKMFCYEGQHLTTKTVSFKAYDDDCPVHERWEPVVASDVMTTMTVGESLKRLKGLLKSDEVIITLNDAFVDFVEHRATGQQSKVMKPARAVADYVEQHTTLRGFLTGDLLQHEYHEIDDTFPYQQLTLKEVGIPAWDVLSTNRGFVMLDVRCKK